MNEHVLLNYFERAVTVHLTISSTRSLCTLVLIMNSKSQYSLKF